MKKNLRLTVVSSLIIMMAFVLNVNSQAQQRGQQGPPPMPSDQEIEEMVDELSETLSLTDEQETKISKLYTQHFEDAKEKMEAGRPDREEMEQLKSDLESDVKELLDEEQQEKYDEFVAKQQSQRKGKRPERR